MLIIYLFTYLLKFCNKLKNQMLLIFFTLEFWAFQSFMSVSKDIFEVDCKLIAQLLDLYLGIFRSQLLLSEFFKGSNMIRFFIWKIRSWVLFKWLVVRLNGGILPYNLLRWSLLEQSWGIRLLSRWLLNKSSIVLINLINLSSLFFSNNGNDFNKIFHFQKCSHFRLGCDRNTRE